jgi:hypothetical protein
MLDFDQLADLWRGRMPEGKRIAAELHVGEHRLVAEVRASGDQVLLFGIPKASHPGAMAGVDAAFRARVEAGDIDEFHVRLDFPKHRYAERTMRAGWLRAAYLVAFAALGYRYALDPTLAPVREQLASPGIAVLDGYFSFVPDAPIGVRQMLLIPTPAALACLIIQMGRYCVVLPPLDGASDFYRRLDRDALAREGRNGIVGAKLVPWPEEPVHALDRQAAMHSSR